jgi:hypothetical protein
MALDLFRRDHDGARRQVAAAHFGKVKAPEPADRIHGRIAAYQLGYFVSVPRELVPYARAAALVTEAIAAAWLLWQFYLNRTMSNLDRAFWEWALMGIMMLVLAPQISQDYMVLTLGAFSYILAGCLLRADRWIWAEYAAAVLLVGNVLPRGVFARLIGIDPMARHAGADHMTRAEAYQYFGFPLLGLLLLLHVWSRVAPVDRGESALRQPPSD